MKPVSKEAAVRCVTALLGRNGSMNDRTVLMKIVLRFIEQQQEEAVEEKPSFSTWGDN